MTFVLRACALLSLALLTACADTTPTPERPDYTPVVACLVAAETGSMTDLEDSDFGGLVSVRAGEHFTSAAGEECRRGSVLSAGHEAEVVVICKGADGTWRMAPRIWGQRVKS